MAMPARCNPCAFDPWVVSNEATQAVCNHRRYDSSGNILASYNTHGSTPWQSYREVRHLRAMNVPDRMIFAAHTGSTTSSNRPSHFWEYRNGVARNNSGLQIAAAVADSGVWPGRYWYAPPSGRTVYIADRDTSGAFPASEGAFGYTITKYDEFFNVLWTAVGTPASNEVYHHVMEEQAGYLYVLCHNRDSLGGTAVRIYYIAKLDASTGSLVSWLMPLDFATLAFFDPHFYRTFALASTDDTRFLMGATLSSTRYAVQLQDNDPATGDANYDSALWYAWKPATGGGAQAIVSKIVRDSSGNVYVVGRCTLDSSSTVRCSLEKFNSAGTSQWVRNTSTTLTDVVLSPSETIVYFCGPNDGSGNNLYAQNSGGSFRFARDWSTGLTAGGGQPRCVAIDPVTGDLLAGGGQFEL